MMLTLKSKRHTRIQKAEQNYIQRFYRNYITASSLTTYYYIHNVNNVIKAGKPRSRFTQTHNNSNITFMLFT